MRRLAPLLLSVSLAGCGWWRAPASSLRPKAAMDLDCPGNELHLAPVSGDCSGRAKSSTGYECTFRVSGCGKTATYRHVPGTKRWVQE